MPQIKTGRYYMQQFDIVVFINLIALERGFAESPKM